jgi:radical SAM superfamily enzyme
MINTCIELNKLDIQGIKIHSLNIVKNSIWGEEYLHSPFPILTREEYIDTVIKQLEVLKEEIVIQRLTSDPIMEELIAPNWNNNKTQLLNDIDKEMVRRNTYQGIKKS